MCFICVVNGILDFRFVGKILAGAHDFSNFCACVFVCACVYKNLQIYNLTHFSGNKLYQQEPRIFTICVSLCVSVFCCHSSQVDYGEK